jgi:glycine/D-amino acid oxidase-like deaminating enzyme
MMASLAGAALAGQARAAGAVAPNAGLRVAVIGAGIIGASIAYHLARDGARVTVLEKEAPAMGATGNSFAWLNAGGKRPRPYHTLNLLGLLGWHRLQTELGAAALPMQWGGCVQWRSGADDAARTREGLLRQQEWGYPIQSIEPAQLSALMPGLTPGAVEIASFSSVEGTVNPRTATRALLDAAAAMGATIEHPVGVTGFDAANGRVRRVMSSQGALEVDAVVLAAGLGCMPLAAMLGARVPIESSPGVLAHTEPGEMILPRLAFGPGANMKQPPDGSFVTGASFAGTPDMPATRATGEALLADARAYLPALAGLKLGEVTLGHRVLPADSFPVVGHLPGSANAYVAAMHSGMTMAPLIGEMAATELLGGPKVDLLETFRPSRFAS